MLDIQEVVSRSYKIDSKKLFEKTRKREISLPRQIAMYFSQILTRSTLKTTGEYYGLRDHTTTMYSYKSVKDLRDTYKEFNTEILNIAEELLFIANK